jgi:organic radical activating enzyme
MQHGIFLPSALIYGNNVLKILFIWNILAVNQSRHLAKNSLLCCIHNTCYSNEPLTWASQIIHMNSKISEIFFSIQGEGPYAGVPQVFVRFFECNMHCVWCDTPGSIGDGKREFKEFSADDLLERVDSFYEDCHSVSITGGEPLLQADFLKSFCRGLHQAHKKVYLDTNGTLPDALESVIKGIDIIAMDIKLPSSTRQKSFWPEHSQFLKIARQREVFIKVVVSLNTRRDEVQKAARLVADVDPEILFILQPNYLDMKKGVIEECVEHQKSCAKILKDVRILPQMHKFMKLR